jgi:predicted DNA-binding transcriptional regulator YafY
LILADALFLIRVGRFGWREREPILDALLDEIDEEGISTLAVHSGRSQMIRLLQLILALQSNRYPNARWLAELCDVSRRTIYRDLETLEAAGIPVKYMAERRGYELSPRFLFRPPELDEKEAQALLVLAHLGNGDDGLGLRRHARSAAWKAIQGLDGETKDRVLALAEMVQSRDVELVISRERRAVYEAVLEAIASRRQLQLWVLDGDATALNSTRFSPYRLVLAGPMWYLIGRSSLHRGVQVYRLPRIRRAELTSESYAMPPRFDLREFLSDAWTVGSGSNLVEIVLRFSSHLAPELEEQCWHHSQRATALGDGRLELRLRLSGIREVLSWILGFGADVEVVSPPELRDLVREQAERVAQIHKTDTPRPAPERSTVPSDAEDAAPISQPSWLRN